MILLFPPRHSFLFQEAPGLYLEVSGHTCPLKGPHMACCLDFAPIPSISRLPPPPHHLWSLLLSLLELMGSLKAPLCSTALPSTLVLQPADPGGREASSLVPGLVSRKLELLLCSQALMHSCAWLSSQLGSVLDWEHWEVQGGLSPGPCPQGTPVKGNKSCLPPAEKPPHA